MTIKNILVVTAESKQDKSGKLYMAVLTDEGEQYTVFDTAVSTFVKSERAVMEIDYVLSGQWKNITKARILARLPPKTGGYNAEDKRNRLGCLTAAKDLFNLLAINQGDNLSSKVIETAEAFYQFVNGEAVIFDAANTEKGGT